jgi:hypothetical protein
MSVPAETDKGTGPEEDQCYDLCGDGYCNEFGKKFRDSCDSVKSSCPETPETCPLDCN